MNPAAILSEISPDVDNAANDDGRGLVDELFEGQRSNGDGVHGRRAENDTGNQHDSMSEHLTSV